MHDFGQVLVVQAHELGNEGNVRKEERDKQTRIILLFVCCDVG